MPGAGKHSGSKPSNVEKAVNEAIKKMSQPADPSVPSQQPQLDMQPQENPGAMTLAQVPPPPVPDPNQLTPNDVNNNGQPAAAGLQDDGNPHLPGGVDGTNPFIVPAYYKENTGFTGDKIEWLRATTVLGPETVVAIRANEAYKDSGAFINGERHYVRAAMLRAGTIDVIRVHAKNPVIVLRNFSPTEIKQDNSPSAIVAAQGRVAWHASPRGKKITLQRAIPTTPQYRITAPVDIVQRLLENGTPEMCVKVGDHHVQGIAVAHAYLLPEAVQHARDAKALITDLDNIVTSTNEAKQITIRATGKINPNIVYDFAARLQNADPSLGIEGLQKCEATYRTHNCVRMTMANDITPQLLREIRLKLPPETRVFTDVPIDVWGPGRDDAPRAPRGPRKPREPKAPKHHDPDIPEGYRLLRAAADYAPHPATFGALAEAIGGKLISVDNSRFTTRPMGCKIAVPADMDLSEYLEAAFTLESETGESPGVWKFWLSGQMYV